MLLKTKIIATNRTVEHKVQQAVLPTLSGELDQLPEQAFYLVGDIKEALEKAQKLKE